MDFTELWCWDVGWIELTSCCVRSDFNLMLHERQEIALHRTVVPNVWSAGYFHLLNKSNQVFMTLRYYIEAGGAQLVCSWKSDPWEPLP